MLPDPTTEQVADPAIGDALLIARTGRIALVRSLRLRAPPLIRLTAIALAAVNFAWLSGSEFVGHMQTAASLAMALATAVAILCHALMIYLIGVSWGPSLDESEHSDAAQRRTP